MLRATKRLIARLFCLNMKKAKNQRRLVIIVALIGVYYLGKHSSSLSVRENESEKERYLRGPLQNGANYTGAVVERPQEGKTEQVQHNLGKLLSKVNDSQRVLQKRPNNPPQVHREDAVKIADEISTTAMASEPKVTPTFPAEQINQQVKKPQPNDHKGNKQHEDINTNKVSDTSPTEASQVPNQEIIASTGKANDKSLVQADTPKPTITTPRTPSQTAVTTEPTASQPASPEGSTSKEAATETTTLYSKDINPAKVDHHLQNLLEDKKIFGFVNKNTTYQSQHTDILEIAPYSQLLQYQISRTKPPSVGGSQSNDNFLYKYGYSKTTSDKLPLLRSVPDNRDSRCMDEQYAPNKLDISVITVVQNSDSVSIVLRMLVSLLHRTPQPVLKEIILVNDVATWDTEESNLLQLFVAKLPKVKMISHNQSLGLAQCMNSAAKMATGDVLAFLSPKIEVAHDWHIALLAWLAEYPNDMVLPVIEPIHWRSLEYSKSKTPVQIRGGFTWGLTFRWKIIPDEEKQRRQNLPIELRTPVYNGAIILMSRLHYNTLMGANEAIEGHDSVAVAMELSLKQWMCGGMILTIPCSRAGFIYIMESPILSSWMIKNRLVIAESLMDNYRSHFYNSHFFTSESAATASENFTTNIKNTKILRDKLNCLSFSWYMENIYYDKKEPRANSQYAGLVRGAGKCVDAASYTIGRPATCRACKNRSITQQFELDNSSTLVFDEDLILGQRKSKPPSGSPIEVLKRRTMSKNQEWRYDLETTHLIHTTSGLCMTCLRGVLTLATCDDKNTETQGWKFDWTRPG